MSDVPIEDQIACVKRELAMRKAVYPKWVAAGRMKAAAAAQEIDRMEAVLWTLEDWRDPNDDEWMF